MATSTSGVDGKVAAEPVALDALIAALTEHLPDLSRSMDSKIQGASAATRSKLPQDQRSFFDQRLQELRALLRPMA